MSSLVTTASNWTSNDTIPKKRVSTMRKTVKLRQSHQQGDNGDNPQFIPNSSNHNLLQPSSIAEIQHDANDRNNRVSSLINTITSVESNEHNKMGDFKPISPPTINVKKDMEPVALSRDYTPSAQSYLDASSQHKNPTTGSTYGINDTDAAKYSNYMNSYEAPKTNYTKPYYANMGISNSNSNSSTDTKLMEKINYMLHLLEEQQHEKTNNITEEFILYTFLGVFIIFIVDAFARTGKYTR